MKATIWHNPRCSTSREVLGILHDAGADVTVVEYLKHPPTAAELSRLYGRAGMRPADGLRRQDPDATAFMDRDDFTVLAAMEIQPALIQRPLVETERGVCLARPPERVRDIL